MIVLKKFGATLLTLLLANTFSFAQTNDLIPSKTKQSIPLRVEAVQYTNPVITKGKVSEFKTVTKPVDQSLQASRTIKKEASTKKESSTNFADEMLDWVKDKYASMINVMPNQLSNVMLYSFIDDWYGTRYRMGGASKKGIDCSAFTQNLYKYVFGMNIVRTACLQFNASQRIKNISDLKEGDLVFFRVNTSRISHVGVYLSNNYFVHSACSKGVSIARLDNAYWSKFYAGGGRILTN
jgi:cell wall-associated NlpC family hydrolase